MPGLREGNLNNMNKEEIVVGKASFKSRLSLIKIIFEPRVYISLIAMSLLLAIPASTGSSFVYHVFITICLYAALSTAWNIVGGYAGQLSLGHTVFYGIGGYTTALLMKHYGLSPWLSMWVGALLAALVGIVISYPCFRLRGPFYALGSIAFLEVFRLLATHEKDLTGGAAGLIVPLKIGWKWMIFREKMPFLLIAFGMLCAIMLISLAIKKSRFGYQMIAVREREDAAMSAGINAVRVKLSAVFISAGLTAMVGSLHAMYTTFLEPGSMFSLAFAIQIAMFSLIGGLGTVAGPLAGTLLVVPLTELARGWLGSSASGLHGFVYGAVLVLVVLTLPSGIVGRFGALIGRFVDRFPGARPQCDPEIEVPPSPERAVVDEEQPVLVTKNLVKRFGGLLATDNVSLQLNKQEILGLIGPNGAGKTTVFNQLSGFIIPESGSVDVYDASGKVLSPKNPYAFAHAGIGRTFQIVQPFGRMTVLENIMVGALHKYATTAEARLKALQVAKQVRLFDDRHAIASNLTIGGLKRLEVARVLAMEPQILLLDEVMAGQNQTDVNLALEMIRNIRNSGVSIIAIEHNMHAIMKISDRVIVINSGQIIAQGTPEEVGRNKAVIEAYLGEEYINAQVN
jgi:branched-chain amino acid transport system permease protein